MRKRRKLLRAVMVVLTGLLVAATAVAQKKFKVATTIGMVADLVKQVGGDRVEVDQLLGPGVDLHLYKPAATDVTRLACAWRMSSSTPASCWRAAWEMCSPRWPARGKRSIPSHGDTFSKSRLLEPPEFEGHYDPHIWFDVSMWAECLPTVITAMSELDPAGKDIYEKNGAAAKKRMAASFTIGACDRGRKTSGGENSRILVTSHDAYNYFGRALWLQGGGHPGSSPRSRKRACRTSRRRWISSRKRSVKAIWLKRVSRPRRSSGSRRTRERRSVGSFSPMRRAHPAKPRAAMTSARMRAW